MFRSQFSVLYYWSRSNTFFYVCLPLIFRRRSLSHCLLSPKWPVSSPDRGACGAESMDNKYLRKLLFSQRWGLDATVLQVDWRCKGGMWMQLWNYSYVMNVKILQRVGEVFICFLYTHCSLLSLSILKSAFNGKWESRFFLIVAVNHLFEQEKGREWDLILLSRPRASKHVVTFVREII